MNYGVIRFVVGWTLMLEGALMVPSAAVAVIYGEDLFWDFAAAIALCIICGLLAKMKRPAKREFFAREGCVSVALSWVALSVMGSLPFLFSGAISDPIDALFETVSGFTTTGASILPEVESLPRSILFWRSFTHWIGGMGVLVFLLILLPMTGGFSMNIMKAESPGPSVSRLVPKVRTTAKILYSIYIGMTIIQVVLLVLGKMSLFDALTLTFGTAGTGGFGIRNDSVGSFSSYHQIVTTIFMILFGINFNAYYFILLGKAKAAFKIEEVRGYLAIIGVATLAIAVNIYHMYGSLAETLRHAAFQVASIITTTGYTTTDFNQWPEVSRTILVILMFIGACAGSTGGGIKVSRILILLKTVKKEIGQYLHPKNVKKIKMDGKSIEHEVVRSTNVFMMTYFLIFTGSVLLLALDGLDLITNFTAVATTLNNVGPGLELVGPMSNFSVYSGLSKFVMVFDMLAGRLELFPLLLLFCPETWKKF